MELLGMNENLPSWLDEFKMYIGKPLEQIPIDLRSTKYTMFTVYSNFFISSQDISKILDTKKIYKEIRYIPAFSINDFFNHWEWNIEQDAKGNVVGVRTRKEFTSDEKIFSYISPLVRAGSYILMEEQGGQRWMYYFDGEKQTSINYMEHAKLSLLGKQESNITNTKQLGVSDENLEYYTNSWGINLLDLYNPVFQCYEAWFHYQEFEDSEPLRIGCVINIPPGDEYPVSNFIVFQNEKTGNIAGVNCVHTIGEIPDKPDITPREIERHIEKTNYDIAITPEEHFIALRSYVACITETGILKMLNVFYSDWGDDLPFGFNPLMQQQVIKALRTVAPRTSESIMKLFTQHLLENAPRGWLVDRLPIICERFHITNIEDFGIKF
jgi:hypothetical protein